MSAIVKYEDSGAIAPRTISHGYDVVASDITKYFNTYIPHIPHMTPEEFGLFRDYARQMKWLKEHIDEIKEIWSDIVDGQVTWNAAQAEMVKNGLKGAEKIEKNVVDMAVAVYKLQQRKEQEDYRLTNAKAIADGETRHYKIVNDAEKEVALKEALETANTEIERIKNAPQNAAGKSALEAEWKELDCMRFEQASMFLGLGSNAPSHPRFPGNQEQSLGGSATASFSQQGSRQGFSSQPARAADSIRFAFNWSGNAAKSARRFGGSIKRGIGRISRFFGGKS